MGEELMKRPEKRKVLMVLSDGLPEDERMNKGQMKADLIDRVLGLEARGVEVFGVGIQTDAVKKFYRWHTVVNDTSDLEKELVDRMSNVLVGGAWDARKAS
jgi:cobalamin biosynthesis protein CobT